MTNTLKYNIIIMPVADGEVTTEGYRSDGITELLDKSNYIKHLAWAVPSLMHLIMNIDATSILFDTYEEIIEGRVLRHISLREHRIALNTSVPTSNMLN